MIGKSHIICCVVLYPLDYSMNASDGLCASWPYLCLILSYWNGGANASSFHLILCRRFVVEVSHGGKSLIFNLIKTIKSNLNKFN